MKDAARARRRWIGDARCPTSPSTVTIYIYQTPRRLVARQPSSKQSNTTLQTNREAY